MRAAERYHRGVVTSNKMEKTCVVKLERSFQHSLYGKTVRNSKTVKAHDIIGVDIGDTVEIMETRPISKEKRWRVTQIVEKVK